MTGHFCNVFASKLRSPKFYRTCKVLGLGPTTNDRSGTSLLVIPTNSRLQIRCNTRSSTSEASEAKRHHSAEPQFLYTNSCIIFYTFYAPLMSTMPARTNPTFLSLPPEILLMIANYYLVDFLFWENSRFKYLRKITYERNLCTYLTLARAHPYLWRLLMGQKLLQSIVKETDFDFYEDCGIFGWSLVSISSSSILSHQPHVDGTTRHCRIVWS